MVFEVFIVSRVYLRLLGKGGFFLGVGSFELGFLWVMEWGLDISFLLFL